MFYSSDEPKLTYSAIELHLIDNYCRSRHSKVSTFINQTQSSISYKWIVESYEQSYRLEFEVFIESDRPIKYDAHLLDLKRKDEEYGYHLAKYWDGYVESAINLYLIENKITYEANLVWYDYLKRNNRNK